MNRFFLLLFCSMSVVVRSQLPDFLPEEDLHVWIPVQGNVSNVLANNFAAFTSNGATLGPDRFGNPNSAVDLPGMIEIPNSGGLWSNDFTLAFWTRKDANLGHNVIQVGEIGGALQFSAGWTSLNGALNSNSQPRIYLGPMNCQGGYSPGGIQTACTATTGEWMHVAYVYNADTLSIFKNGQLCEYSNVSNGVLAFSCLNEDFGTYIGGDIGGGLIEYYNGAFDDIAIYSRGLAAIEIQSIFNETVLTPGCMDVLACNFDSTANMDDGNCFYPDTCGICGGNNSTCAGCMDSVACNFDTAALIEGDCIYPIIGDDCHAGAIACGDGQIWIPESQQCITISLFDSNFDGCVTGSDLLDFLSAFGYCLSPEPAEFTCGAPFGYRGYDYATLQIGNQCWFSENLRTEHYANGDTIQGGLSLPDWSSTFSGAQAVYGEGMSPVYTGNADEVENLVAYGRLYNRFAVDDSRGLCPNGWHVPTDGEWITLEINLGISPSEANLTGWRGTDQGAQMKASSSEMPGWNGTNSSGFSALPGGVRDDSGYFSNEGDVGYWWSASSDGQSDPWGRKLDSGDDGIYRYNYLYSRLGFSVRCLKNESE